MKRIIDGVTYNTDTSTKVARAEFERDPPRWASDPPGGQVVAILYLTRGGAFFLHEEITTDEHDESGEWIVRHNFEPMTREQAEKWVLEGEIELFGDVFPEPPEASAEEESAASVYFRMPSALKHRIEALAKKEGLSLNAWAIRCFENCAALVRGSDTAAMPLRFGGTRR